MTLWRMKTASTENYMRCSSAETMKITCIVITRNEEKNIKECLESVNFLDEIIIVDSRSTDRTSEISRSYTEKIFSTEIENVTQKRIFSLGKSSHDWIIFVDADERISPELKEELILLKEKTGTDCHGYYINRKNIYFGKWIRNCGVYPDLHIRLFNKNNSEITNRIVHEGIIVHGKTSKLNGHLVHFTVDSLEHMMRKINYYSSMQSTEYFHNGKRVSRFSIPFKAISAFLRVYISRGGFKDGIRGMFVSFQDSMVNLLTNLKLLKLQNKL